MSGIGYHVLVKDSSKVSVYLAASYTQSQKKCTIKSVEFHE